MKSDLHHLFPTYKNWNSTRSDYPYAEILDDKTEKWIRFNKSYKSIPTENIDEYSEYYNKKFEPKESHKGNTACAIFYFHTMYPDKAGKISKISNLKILYLWHMIDPPDEEKKRQTDLIEKFQGNKNSYIDYPELVKKARLN